MSATMTSEERYWSSFWRTGDCDGRGGIAPRSQWVDFGNVCEISEGVESCSSDDSQSNGLWVGY
jgi:hypothetical protein